MLLGHVLGMRHSDETVRVARAGYDEYSTRRRGTIDRASVVNHDRSVLAKQVEPVRRLRPERLAAQEDDPVGTLESSDRIGVDPDLGEEWKGAISQFHRASLKQRDRSG